jgi:hypothetical protein
MGNVIAVILSDYAAAGQWIQSEVVSSWSSRTNK